MTQYFLIGRLEAPVGFDGFINISLHTDFPERFTELNEVYIDFWGDKKKFFIEKVNRHKNSVQLKLKNFDSLREVQLLTGREIFITEDKVIELPEHNYFVHDLLGSKVFSGNKLIGEISDIGKTPANDIVVIRNKKGEELLLPMIDKFIEKFDAEKKIMLIKKDIDLSDDED